MHQQITDSGDNALLPDECCDKSHAPLSKLAIVTVLADPVLSEGLKIYGAKIRSLGRALQRFAEYLFLLDFLRKEDIFHFSLFFFRMFNKEKLENVTDVSLAEAAILLKTAYLALSQAGYNSEQIYQIMQQKDFKV